MVVKGHRKYPVQVMFSAITRPAFPKSHRQKCVLAVDQTSANSIKWLQLMKQRQPMLQYISHPYANRNGCPRKATDRLHAVSHVIPYFVFKGHKSREFSDSQEPITTALQCSTPFRGDVGIYVGISYWVWHYKTHSMNSSYSFLGSLLSCPGLTLGPLGPFSAHSIAISVVFHTHPPSLPLY